ncbi:ComEC/Rec2 family competence protein [Patescibacteria group bacterium]|nr:ComEC/Rec2 family competence protein [Patescibacteria group bacterium]MBU1757979.1 ComEC/Rec2 family competence protein [Patescibacteria group bacterium]
MIRVPFYIRTFIILIIIVTYGFLCGMDSSVFRAVIMGGI